MTQRGEEVMVGLDDQICSLGTSRSTEKPSSPHYFSAARRFWKGRLWSRLLLPGLRVAFPWCPLG